MQATVDEAKVLDLGGKLKNGQAELKGILEALRGTAVADIHVALEGTSTAGAFDEKVTELTTQLKEALPAFEAAYGFSLPLDRIISLPGGDTSVTARAAAQGISGVNAGMVYGTDGALSALDLTVMSDPLAAQIVYEVAPVIR